jgi:hypothetical protein
MAHYAMLDENNIVTFVFVGKNENELFNGQEIDWEAYYKAKRTSYNTIGGVHVNGGTPFRKNYAGVGYTYRADIDAFVPPQPFVSWVLNNDTAQWEPPMPMPTDGQMYSWDEDTTSWIAQNG